MWGMERESSDRVFTDSLDTLLVISEVISILPNRQLYRDYRGERMPIDLNQTMQHYWKMLEHVDVIKVSVMNPSNHFLKNNTVQRWSLTKTSKQQVAMLNISQKFITHWSQILFSKFYRTRTSDSLSLRNLTMVVSGKPRSDPTSS